MIDSNAQAEGLIASGLGSTLNSKNKVRPRATLINLECELNWSIIFQQKNQPYNDLLIITREFFG
jgi:hypothetical protein